MDTIAADSWHFCCLAVTIRNCIGYMEEHLTCDPLLLTSATIKAVLWISTLVSFNLNTFVIVYRLMQLKHKMSTFNILLVNLGLSDMLMSVYCLGLGTADAWFGDIYIFHEMSWRRGSACKVLGFLANMSIASSIVTLVYKSVFYICVFITKYSISNSIAVGVISMSWLFSIAVLLVPFLSIGESRSVTCLYSSFDSKLPGTVFMIASNSLNFLLIIVAIVGLLWVIISVYFSGSEVRKVGHVTGGGKQSKRVTMLALQLVCYIMCYIPLQCVISAHLFCVNISPDVLN